MEEKITVIDSLMGTGKTSWAISELLDKNPDKNYLYVTPYLDEVARVKSSTNRQMLEPKNLGAGKLSNIASLLQNSFDIVSTHELFRRFDGRCKDALRQNRYTLILDEVIDAVSPFRFEGKQDFQYLLENHDIEVDSSGLIHWIGSDLDTRFDDVRILAKNQCLFTVDGKFFLWHFPHDVFELFDKVYILTYLFNGSIMQAYFDMYHIEYEIKSITQKDGKYLISDYHKPDKRAIKSRLNIYDGILNKNLNLKPTGLSATYYRSNYHKDTLLKLKANLYNYCQNIIKASSDKIMWTTFGNSQSLLKGKGYARGFVACNARGTNNYQDRTCLMYAINWYPNPEICKFFQQHGIDINQDAIALSALLQWIWRSNIRIADSKEVVNLYLPSERMRTLLTNWLNE